MLSEPTITDFQNFLRSEADEAVRKLEGEANALKRKFAADQRYRSGSMVEALLDATDQAFRQHLDHTLSVFETVSNKGQFDRTELRNAVAGHLDNALHRLTDANGIARLGTGGFEAKPLNQRIEILRQLTRQRLSILDFGWTRPQDRAGTTIHNSGTIFGGLQQNSPGARMTVVVSINVESARRAADDLATALATVPQEAPVIDMRADVDTLRAQLRKSSPSLAVLREIGLTLRNVSEGVVGGLLTPPAVAALTQLLTTLSLS